MPGSTAVKGIWQVKDGLALDYLIIPSSNSGVEDLWVDWKQSFLLLEELTPNFSKIWTLNGISYCPLLDILQAAVKSNGLARELLDSLVQPLFEGEHFEEVELENEEGGLWQACRSEKEDEEQRTMIDEPQNQDEAHLEGIAGEKRRQSDQKFKVRDVSSLLSCGICLYRAPGRVRLYSHYVTKHPDSPCQHPPRPPGTLHACPACGELYSSRSLLRRHQHSAHQSLGLSSEREEHIKSGESNTCLSCGRTFATRIWLYKHCAADHPENEDIRPERPFKVKGLRLAHLHERKNLECGLPGCDLTFTHFKGLVRHERTHTEAFICVLCGKATWTSNALVEHCEADHKEKSKHICRVCGFYNFTEALLRQHTLQVHMKGTKEYRCQHCDFKTSVQSTFAAHVRNHQKQFCICEHCGKECSTQQALTSHRRCHEVPASSFPCPYCQKQFARASLLKIHKRIHTKEKPFQCIECGQCFGSQSSLIKHTQNLHIPEEDMPYKCQECGKTFSKARKKVYLGHLKQHRGVKDHLCVVCNAAFSSRGYLSNHFKKVHKRKLFEMEKEIKLKSDMLPVPSNRIA